MTTSPLQFDQLPKTFSPAKPLSSIEPALADRWEKAGKLIIQRKRDGMRHFLVVSTQGCAIYTRRMDNATETFRQLANDLAARLPAGTILDAEYVVVKQEDGRDLDNFSLAGTVCRSSPARGRLMHAQHQGTFFVFDVLYFDGHPVFRLPYRERYAALQRLAPQWPAGVQTMAALDCSLDEAKRRVLAEKWEGLVLWNADEATMVQLTGHPKRCNAYKWKPILEDDFIATGYELGTNSLSSVVGALTLAQMDEDGDLVDCGKVGTGLDLATRTAALHWSYPCVVQVQFSERLDSGLLRFPVFVRQRLDKATHECHSRH
jgi:ATP-dependent DNA ligase